MGNNTFIQLLIVLTGFLILGWLAFGYHPRNQDSQATKIREWDGGAEIVTYNGHEYIRFDGGNATWGCHNPDCKCMRKEVKNGRDQD